MMLDQLERFGAGGAFADRDDIRHHEVANARGDVAEINGQRLVEARKDGVDAGVGVAATRGHVAGLAQGGLVGGVRDGRADGVGIGVFVADDVRRLGAGGDRGGHHGGCRGGLWQLQPDTKRGKNKARPRSSSGPTEERGRIAAGDRPP